MPLKELSFKSKYKFFYNSSNTMHYRMSIICYIMTPKDEVFLYADYLLTKLLHG